MRFRLAAADFAKKPRQRHPDSVPHQRDEYQQDNEADQDGDDKFHVSKLVEEDTIQRKLITCEFPGEVATSRGKPQFSTLRYVSKPRETILQFRAEQP